MYQTFVSSFTAGFGKATRSMELEEIAERIDLVVRAAGGELSTMISDSAPGHFPKFTEPIVYIGDA